MDGCDVFGEDALNTVTFIKLITANILLGCLFHVSLSAEMSASECVLRPGEKTHASAFPS